MDIKGMFKNACRICTEYAVVRYLMSNAEGRENGAEKAEYHIKLCQFYVAFVRGQDDPATISPYDKDFKLIHAKTQQLTSYLDDAIGFPLKGTPDYDSLKVLFFERFHELALSVFIPDNIREVK